MPRYEDDPSEVAARYRVRNIGEAEFELFAPDGSSTSLSVRRRGVFLHFKATPQRVRWHADEESEPFYAVDCLVTELSIGHRGEEGWFSNLVDDCLFVIDREALRYVPLTELRILSEEKFNVQKADLAGLGSLLGLKGEPHAAKPEAHIVSDHALGRATVVHCPAMSERDIYESLECAVGLPHAHFQKLLDGCLSGRISDVYLHGIAGALSASFQYGTPRDLILCASEKCDIDIDSLTLEYRV